MEANYAWNIHLSVCSKISLRSADAGPEMRLRFAGYRKM